MAFVHGKDSVFKLDSAVPTLTDLSANVMSVDLPDAIDEAETTTLGNDSKTFIQGTSGATLTVEYLWDTTIDAFMYAIKRLTGTFEYHPAGTTAGLPVYSGECFITSIGMPTSTSDVVKISVSYRVTGDITRGTN